MQIIKLDLDLPTCMLLIYTHLKYIYQTYINPYTCIQFTRKYKKLLTPT